MNEETLFAEAIALESPEKRRQFLDEACGGNSELRKSVEKLLHLAENVGSFLEHPPLEAAAAALAGIEPTIGYSDLAASMEVGLAPAFDANAAVVLGDASHSVLKSLDKTVNVPRVLLRQSAAEGADPLTRPTSPEMPDKKSDSRYQLHGEIARGGMGAILKGHDTDLGRDLAIKVLLDAHKDKPEVIQRFVEEAQIGGQLQHPGIAPVYELGQFTDRRPFFSMKLVKGETLSKLLSDRSSLAEDRSRFIGIFEQICQTMAYAHSRAVIHRDLKPANIMVGAFGEVQVMDWGLAKVLPGGGVADEKKAHDKQGSQSVIQTRRSRVGDDTPSTLANHGSQTQMGSVMGTPAYMPPEQALGEIDNLDERADVFGLGAILCEILTGQPPYVGTDGMAVFRQASRGKLDDCLRRLDACGGDEELITLAKQCLAPEPADRPRDAGVLAERVTAYLESVETKLRETELERAAEAARVVELHRRKKLLYAIAGMLLVGLVTAGFAANHFRSLEETQRNLAARNERLAKERETERNAAIAAETRETKLKNDAIRLKDQAEQSRNRADVAATLAENRSEEIRKALYASEMQLALTAERQGSGALRMQALLDHWRPAEGESDRRSWEWYYLRSRSEQAELILDHPASVRAADWSRDGSRVYSGCQDGAIRIWDADTGRLLQSRKGAAAVVSLEVSPDGDRLASVDGKGFLTIRNVDSEEPLLRKRFSAIHSMKWSPDGSQIAIGCQTELLVVESRSGDVVARLESTRNQAVDWNQDGEQLAIASEMDLIVWNIKSDEKTMFKNRFSGWIHTVKWALEGGVLVPGHVAFSLADPQTGKVTILKSLRRTERPVQSAFSKSHNRFAIAGIDHEVRLVDPKSWTVASLLRGHTQTVAEVRWSPDEARLLTASLDGAVRISRIDHLDDDYQHPESFRSLAWRSGGSELACGGFHDGWSLRYPSYKKTHLSILSTGDLTFTDWSPDGGRLAAGARNEWAILGWNSQKITLQSNLDQDAAAPLHVTLVAWEPDGERLLVGSYQNLWVYSTQDGGLLYERKIKRRLYNGTYPQYAKWHPQGRLLAFLEGNGVQVVDVDTGQVQQELQTEQKLTALAWHPTDKLLATARKSDFLVELWDLSTMTKLAEIGGGSGEIGSLEWSPDGSLLAIGGSDKTVRLWNRESQRTVLTLVEDEPVAQMDWDDSGTRLAVSTLGGTKVYDAARGYLVEGSSRALASVDQCILAQPQRVLFRVQRAQLLEKLGRWQEAASDWEALSELRPDDPWYAEQGLAASLQNLKPQAAIAKLEARLAENPDDAVAARLLGSRLLADAGPDDWQLLDVQEAVSEKGAFLLTQPDGSLLAAGDNPDGDVYRVTGKTNLAKITAIRLETIPDERLPGGGSGRTRDGTFHLGDVALESSSIGRLADSGNLALITAWADYSYPNYTASHAINGNPDVGWDPFPRQRERHTAVFELAEAFDPTAEDLLTVRLRTGTRGGHLPKHNLGRFRLAVTDRPHAARLAELAYTLKSDPDAYDPWTLLGIVRSIRNEPDASVKAFIHALDEAAEDEPRRMQILAEAARDEAVFQRILEKLGEDPAVLIAYANSLVKAGKTDSAIALLSGSLALQPDNLAWRWERGKALAASGRWPGSSRGSIRRSGTRSPRGRRLRVPRGRLSEDRPVGSGDRRLEAGAGTKTSKRHLNISPGRRPVDHQELGGSGRDRAATI